MLKAGSQLRQRCAEHPHRRATRQCSRCRTPYCDECSRVQTDAQGVCARCRDEVAELDRIEHPPLEERVERFKLSLRNGIVGLAVLAALIVPLAFVARNLMSTPITPEEFARFKYAAAGSFETQEGINVTSTVLGARTVSATSAQPGFEEKRLIDEYAGTGYPGWRSADATFPQEIVLVTEAPTRFEKALVIQQPTEPPETWARQLEVMVSLESAEGPYRSVTTIELAQAEEIQRFTFEAVDARWIKIVVKSHYGGPYVSLGEFNAYAVPRGPFSKVAQETPAKP